MGGGLTPLQQPDDTHGWAGLIPCRPPSLDSRSKAMALAETGPAGLMASTNRLTAGGRADARATFTSGRSESSRCDGPGGSRSRALALIGVMTAPALDMLWIVLLVLAVVAVPQAFVLDHRERRGRTRR